MNLIDRILIRLTKPKHLILKGCQVENRAALTLGLKASYSKDDYGNRVVSFSNTGDSKYYLNNCEEVIKTKRRLLWWKRQFKGYPLNFRVFSKSFGRWTLMK
jgi:hypothetical protein